MPEQAAAEILKKSGLKQTAGRIALLKVLLKADKPLSHRQICEELGDLYYDPVSVYRSLESFIVAGFVHKVEDNNRSWLYALCTCEEESHCHPHFFCRNCGKCECLRSYSIPRIEDLNNNYIVEEQRYYIKGICSSCKIASGSER